MRRIFVVDDHPILREGICRLLRWMGWDICGEASSAEEALEAIRREVPDLALIDVSMPGMSGIELVRTLRTEFPTLPVSMLSGHAERHYVDEALEAGANGYLLKSNLLELPEAIRQLERGEQYISSSLRG